MANYFLNSLDPNPSDEFTSEELYATFRVPDRKGIRASLKNKRILLISSPDTQNTGQGNYRDRINGDFLYYTGEGRGNNDQTMTYILWIKSSSV